jgi:hypothetical protein
LSPRGASGQGGSPVRRGAKGDRRDHRIFAREFFEPARCLAKAGAHLRRPRIGCVSGPLVYADHRGGSAGSAECLFWRYETLVRYLESCLLSLLGANGSIFALRKKFYAPLSETCNKTFQRDGEQTSRRLGQD